MLYYLYIFFVVKNKSIYKMSDNSELTLSLLGKEYDTLLTQYQQAYQNYIDYVNSNSSSKSSYALLKGRTFWGTAGISESSSNTVEDCQGQCSSLSNCTGATFNSDKKYCWSRIGEGNLIPGLENDFAIIPQINQYTDTLYNINAQLIALNKKMIDVVNNSRPNLHKERETGNDLNNNLMLNYDNLQNEKERINKLMNEYENIENTNKNTSIMVNEKYSKYTVISIFFIIIVILFILLIML